MNAPTFGTTEEGTTFLFVEMPWPWPPRKPFLARHELSDGYLAFAVGADRALRGAVIKRDGDKERVVSSAITCPLVVAPGACAAIFVTWIKQGVMTVMIDNTDVTWPCGLPCFSLANASSDPSKHFDFLGKNAKAITRRRGAFLSLQMRPGTEAGGLDYLFEGLKEEADQLRDLLNLVENGHRAHARGLAARLRLLLHRQGQNPVLQTAASAKNASLIVYTNANPTLKLPITPAIGFYSANLRPTPTPKFPNPIDIDVWLNLPAIHIGETILCHNKVIADLGNTVGSHLELNIMPSVTSLRRLSIGVSDELETGFVYYIRMVARCVLVLCDKLIICP